jgi:hypothetical protein
MIDSLFQDFKSHVFKGNVPDLIIANLEVGFYYGLSNFLVAYINTESTAYFVSKIGREIKAYATENRWMTIPEKNNKTLIETMFWTCCSQLDPSVLEQTNVMGPLHTGFYGGVATGLKLAMTTNNLNPIVEEVNSYFERNSNGSES